MLQTILILALIQGVAEFLPVSSSAHLIIAGSYLSLTAPGFYIVILHVGSLMAILIAFWKDLMKLGLREFMLVCLATLPLVPSALFLRNFVEIYDIRVISSLLVVTGVFLLLAIRLSTGKKTVRELSIAGAILIGIAQAFALLPGLSRLGLTIGAGLILGLKPYDAIKFSIFMAIPAIAGAFAIKMEDKVQVEIMSILIGVGVTFVISLVSIKILKILADKRWIAIVALYDICVGILFFFLAK